MPARENSAGKRRRPMKSRSHPAGQCRFLNDCASCPLSPMTTILGTGSGYAVKAGLALEIGTTSAGAPGSTAKMLPSDSL